ncbi:low-density lipoprotein receptor-related protein 8-like isoform X2 [Mytilus trossulus]|uniref:low-density lipoprotein receptor-related protein 8-like isoform X2 n=1 Tax=Mytilus trossulus TaxID=6551 RepID=UPI0030054CF5
MFKMCSLSIMIFFLITVNSMSLAESTSLATGITCSSDEFRCDSGQCVHIRWRCDRERDCSDGSDELKCNSSTCPAEQFKCTNGKCIHITWRCDGDEDCDDHSDEESCETNSPKYFCKETEWQCKHKNQCILANWRCDGEADCFDGSDEVNCTYTCGGDQFQCDNNQCIANTSKCDGLQDCTDSSDESNCSTSNSCTIKNGGCDHICNENGESKDLCSCRKGYKLEEKTRCVNIDECTVSRAPICSQLCIDKQGTYECECIEGYNTSVVAGDVAGATTCKVNGPRPWLLLANRFDIRKFEVGTWLQETLVDGLSNAVSVDFYRDKYVYWSDVSIQQIARSEIKNGIMSKKQVIVNEDIETPDGIAIDWIHDNLYWTDTGIDTIQVSNLEGDKKATIIDNDLDEPRGIALDPIHGYFYMTDWGKNPKIERIGMDGSTRKIITTDVAWPNAITIDYIDSRIFWIDAKLHTIMSADFDGARIRTVLHNTAQISIPFSMAVFEDNIFWTDWSGEDICMAHKYTGKNYKKMVLGLNSPMGIKVYHESLQNVGHNVCDDNKVNCEYLCLPKPRVLSDDSTSLSYTCVCPDNKNISHNGHTCVPEDMDTTEVATMTTSERTVSGNTNILTTKSSAESQPTSMTTLRADKKLTINSTCENTNECSGKLLCIDGICQCCKQFAWNGTICVKKEEMGKVCTDSVKCQENLECISSRCSCNRSTYWNGIRCVRKKEMGKVCTDSVECQDDLDCISSRCSCNSSTYWNGIRCNRKLPSECADISSDKDGVYFVYPKGKMTSHKISVYCIMNGYKKWTVIQKRTDGSVDFFRTWSEYSNGFGRVDKEHWLGNENIYRLSQDGTHELSIVLEDWEGHIMEANYSTFSVKSEEDNYSLSVSGYYGNAGDCMDYHNSKSFYTKDRDNRIGCAVSRHGGWWYDNCYLANLNGRYNGTQDKYGKYTGLVWYKWNKGYSLKATQMMIRRKYMIT